eukprot:5699493-Ditylum_brightwellii.AAC.1
MDRTVLPIDDTEYEIYHVDKIEEKAQQYNAQLDISQLPQDAVMRQINELVKRARGVKPFQQDLLEIKELSRFPKLKKKIIREMDTVLSVDIPELSEQAMHCH